MLLCQIRNDRSHKGRLMHSDRKRCEEMVDFQCEGAFLAPYMIVAKTGCQCALYWSHPDSAFQKSVCILR